MQATNSKVHTGFRPIAFSNDYYFLVSNKTAKFKLIRNVCKYKTGHGSSCQCCSLDKRVGDILEIKNT